MISFIITIFLALIFAYLSLQNVQAVNIRLGNITFFNIPLYAALIASMAFGVAVAFVISLIDSIARGISLLGKNQKIRSTERSLENARAKIHNLEAEITRLRTGTPRQFTFKGTPFYKPNMFQRIRHRMSF